MDNRTGEPHESPGHGAPRFREHLLNGQSERAWSEFLSQYSTNLSKVIRRFASTQDEQSDCFVFVCEHLAANDCRRLRKFDPNGSAQFTTWLYSVTFNLCRDWHRTLHPRRARFRSLAALTAFEREVYHLVYEMKCEAAQLLERLRGKHPHLSPELLQSALDVLSATITPSQRGRLQSREPRLVPLDDTSPEELTQGHAGSTTAISDPADQADADQLQALLQRALERLPAHERLLLRLRYEKELTLAEIARVAGLKNTQAADRALRRIVETLKSQVAAGSTENAASGPCHGAETLTILAGDGSA